jgi:hemerythrin
MKEVIEWSDALSTGVKEIDDQHKTLVDMLNELNEAVHGGWGKDARKMVIDKLFEYTAIHFATEESLMRVSKYPRADAHKKQHDDLVDMVKDYLKQYEQNPNASSYDLIFFLKRWLTDHIMRDDKLFGGYLVKNGAGVGDGKKSWLRRVLGL